MSQVRAPKSQNVTDGNAGQSPAERVGTDRVMYISWAESCSRSDHTARELGGISHMVYMPVFGSRPSTIIPKYLCQLWMSSTLLLRYRPAAVIVMSPPIFAAFPALIYHLITRRPFGLDNHTAAFSHPRWKRLQWLQNLIARRAAVNLVHNEHLQSRVEQHGGTTVLVKDVPVVYQKGESYPLSDHFNVTVVCSFNEDEPIANILDAARSLPEIRFYITGNPKHLDKQLRDNVPPNAELTGFVSDAAFGDLLTRSDVVMSLTTRDHTMLRGAWEAIYQSTPVIVSDWPILRESFSDGALHVDNSPASIANAVMTCKSRSLELQKGAKLARGMRLARWEETKRHILNALFNQ